MSTTLKIARGLFANMPILLDGQQYLCIDTSEIYIGNGGRNIKCTYDFENVDNTADIDKPISKATQSALDIKAPLANPKFTGTVSGINKTMVGLSNVDNTADISKGISTAVQTALNAKAPLANPRFTGTVAGITKAMIGLASADNTADAAKSVKYATSAGAVPMAGVTNLTEDGKTSSIILQGGYNAGKPPLTSSLTRFRFGNIYVYLFYWYQTGSWSATDTAIGFPIASFPGLDLTNIAKFDGWFIGQFGGTSYTRYAMCNSAKSFIWLSDKGSTFTPSSAMQTNKIYTGIIIGPCKDF